MVDNGTGCAAKDPLRGTFRLWGGELADVMSGNGVNATDDEAGRRARVE